MEPLISCHDLYLLLVEDDDEELLVIDCRLEEDWQRYPEQIPGALKLGFAELSSFAAALPDDELIVLSDCSNDGRECRRAFRLLRRRHLDVVCLRGGLRAWIASGYPTEPHVPRAMAVARAQAVTAYHATVSREVGPGVGRGRG